jgi:hypothetical protein
MLALALALQRAILGDATREPSGKRQFQFMRRMRKRRAFLNSSWSLSASDKPRFTARRVGWRSMIENG